MYIGLVPMNYMQYEDGLGKVAESERALPMMLWPACRNRIRPIESIYFESRTRHGLAFNLLPDFGSLQRDSVAHNTLQHRIESDALSARGRLPKSFPTPSIRHGLALKSETM